MRIAQVAPLFEHVPPRRYGGTERVVSWLTNELVRQGHEVTLFATRGSKTAARLVPSAPHALRIGDSCLDGVPWHVAMLERVASLEREHDLVHFHLDHIHLPLARRLSTPSVTTQHGRLDAPGVAELYRAFADAPLVSISDAQRLPLPGARWMGTVHHGLPWERTRLGRGDGGYLVFLGRMSREKRPDRAIEIAKRTGLRLKVAAKVDPADRAYFEREIRPLLDHPLIEVIGEVGELEKGPLLCDARALVFPIDWPEPFGLVLIEAMAHGTPVVAFAHGSVPEVVDHGVTGFVVDDVEGAVRAVRHVGELDRARVRRVAERRFSAAAMARAYVRIYEQLTGRAITAVRAIA